MQTILREQAKEYFFDGRMKPVLRVEQGESFKVETEDAYSGNIKSLEDWLNVESFPWAQTTPWLSNPMGGPIYVEGAEKGDVLCVHIESITVDEIGRTSWRHLQGPLGDSRKWPELSEPFFHIIRHLPGPSGTTRDGKGVMNERISWNIAPCIGSIGVSPEVEVVASSCGQGPWGGNVDIRDITEGTTVLFPVFHEGALLYVGDVHGSQGDTEFYGIANECRAEITLKCEVIKQKRIPFFRLEKPDSIVSVYCYRPLETAIQTAVFYLMEWMVTDYGVGPREAYLYTTINPDFRINVYQMTRFENLQFTVGAEIPKRYLRPAK